jgi:hypothetical protein
MQEFMSRLQFAKPSETFSHEMRRLPWSKSFSYLLGTPMLAIIGRRRMGNIVDVIISAVKIALFQCKSHRKYSVFLKFGALAPSIGNEVTLLMGNTGRYDWSCDSARCQGSRKQYGIKHDCRDALRKERSAETVSKQTTRKDGYNQLFEQLPSYELRVPGLG